MSSICLYNFGHVVHHDDWNFKIPGSVFWRIYLMLDGEAEVLIYNSSYKLTPGHLYLIPAFTTHEDRLTGTFTHEYIHFCVENASLDSLFDSFSFGFEYPVSNLALDAFSRIKELCPGFTLETCVPRKYEKKSSYVYWASRYRAMPENVKFEIESCVRVLMAYFMSQSQPKHPDVRPEVSKLRTMIDRNFCDDIKIEELAAIAGLRVETFIRVFKSAYNITPHAYVMSKRMNEAKNLLLLTPLSIKEISAKVGFKDSSYFGAVFKQHTSMTPNQFRREQF